MGWRPSSWWARSRDRQPVRPQVGRIESVETSAAAAGSSTAPPDPFQAGAWRDLAALTPLAATPVQRIAVRDDVRSGLATHADPRFLRPLTHQVDPTVGGLVDGLAAVGRPSVHDDGPELAVPAHATRPAPQVQRRVAWSGSDELDTVRWELPEMPITGEVIGVVTEGGPAAEPSDDHAGSRPDASVVGSSGSDSPLHGSAGADSPLLDASAAPDVTAAPAERAVPVEQRPVEQGGPVEPGGPGEPPRPPQASRPAVLQRTLASLDPPSASTPAVVTVDPAVPPRTGDSTDVPVSGTGWEAGGPAPAVLGPDHDQRPAPASSGAAAPPGPAVGSPPVVARTMTPPVGPPDAMTPAATTGGLAVPDPGPRPELLEPPEPLAQAAPPGFTEVALPLAPTRTIVPATDQPAGRAVSDPIVPPGTAGSSGRPASVQRSLNVGAAVRPPTEAAALPTLPPIAERPASGVVAADSFLTTISLGAAASGLELGTPVSAVGPADESAPPVARRQPASLPSAQRMETESAPVPATSPSRLSSPGIPYPVTGSVSAPPSGALAVGALAVGLPLVQRSSAVHQSSFTAGEPVASGSARSFDSMFGGASSPSGTATEPRSPLLAVPALQRQSFDDSSASATDVPESPPATPPVPDGGATSEATDAAVPAASTAAGSAAVPAGAAPTADVDEMARRLYEPLVARLRAELWLDRERSGVFGDG